MKVLAINNGKDLTAYTFTEGKKGSRYVAYSAFLKGNIMEEIKELCRNYQPDEIVLQLPPTGLDERTRKAIQQGLVRRIASTSNNAVQEQHRPVSLRNLSNRLETQKCDMYRLIREGKSYVHPMVQRPGQRIHSRVTRRNR